MNISLSYNWLKEYVKTNKSAREFAKIFSLHSMTIDRVHEIKSRWKAVVTARIVAIEKHPNADKLRLATVDTGKEKARVVCGAPNIEVGQIVPLVREGGEVIGPDGKNFIVKKANIRGVESSGMLCSKRELGLGDDHTGIFILPQNTKVGEPLEKNISQDDAVFDIEVTSNRPDAMSVIGLARESSAIFKTKFLYKELRPGVKAKKITDAKNYNLNLKVLEKNLCPRYQAVVMADVKVEPSPLWMQARLIQSGIRPINNVVDITNYVLLEYGQPMHVFDAKKLFGYELATNNKRIGYKCLIHVRLAKDGEKIVALDGNTYTLDEKDLVIADSEKPIAIAGIMGGEYSSADKNSKIIIFESANFNPVLVRKTSRKLHLMSESSNLFEKGLSPEGTTPALLRAIWLTQKYANGKVASKIIDTNHKKYAVKKVRIHPKAIESYLGISLKNQEIKSILKLLGFDVAGTSILTVVVPWWRKNDIDIPEDIIEEVARIYGYYKLPSVLPQGELPLRPKDHVSAWQNKCKDILQGMGFTEIYSYSMVSKAVLNKLFISSDTCLKISNFLNEDLEYIRPTLLAGVLECASLNQENFEKIKIFELSRIYISREKDLPEEKLRLTGACFGQKEPFFSAKGTAEFLLKKFGVSNVRFASAHPDVMSVWKEGLFQDIIIGEKIVGRVGFINKKVLDSFGVKKDTVVFNLDFSYLAEVFTATNMYSPPQTFPQIIRDMALVMQSNVLWVDLSNCISQFHPLIRKVQYLSTYTGKGIEGKKSVAMRITFQSDSRTLKSSEVDDIIKQLVVKLGERFGAKLR